MIYLAFLLFFVFDYLRPGSYIPGLDALKLNALVPATAILGTFFGKPPVSFKDSLAETNTKILLTLLALLAFSTVFATVTLSAYTVTKNVFAYILIYWVLIRQVGDLKRLRQVFLTLTFVHLAIAALNPRLFTNPDSRLGINSGAFLGDGNDFSLSVNICIPLCLFLMLESRRIFTKLLWIAALLALVLCVVATKSRGGTLALAAVLLYFWVKSQRKVLMAAVSATVVAFVLAMAPASYFERMDMIADTEEGSAQGRILAWKASLKMAASNPLMGVGAGHFPMAYGNANTRWMTAHSIYFLLLGELGLPGLFVLLTLIGYNLAANRLLQSELKRLPGPQAVTAGNILACTSASLVAFATGGAFLSAAYYPHTYVLAGLLAATRRIVRQQLAQGAAPVEGPAPAVTALAPAFPLLAPGVVSPEWRPRPASNGALYRRRPMSSLS